MEIHPARVMSLDRPTTSLLVRLAALAALAIQLVASLAAAQPVGAAEPGAPHFLRTWERVDKPVADLLEGRSWLWGPYANTEVITEEYAESPGGMREVQYFDKSRMEINNPAGDPNSPWYVTNGLLVVELMTGQMQVGHNDFLVRSPAEINVAGDADDPDGVTYQTFAQLRDLPPLADSAPITQMVDRDGNVTDDATLADYGVTATHHVQVPGIDHQVASPFWAFMNSTGTIYDPELGFVQGNLFPNPFYATGYPLTEAYFVEALVGETPTIVLAQCFERRCLTYTPDNDPGWQVEAGNVGLHYYDWRYEQDDPPPPPPSDGLPAINEVKFWPDDDAPQWVEIYNPSDEPADLGTIRITNGAGDHVSELPDVMLPEGAYMVVYLGASGQDDFNFDDLTGASYDDGAPDEFFDPDHDEVALYRALEGVDSIIDFFAWSYEDVYAPQAAFADAVAAGIWSDGEYFDAQQRDGLNLTHPVMQGETVGRDRVAVDSDMPADWSIFGGADAYFESPGAQNYQETFYDELATLLDAPSRTLAQGQPAQRKWTLMAFFDGRDPKLAQSFVNHIDDMELAGSDVNVNVVAQLVWKKSDGSLAGSRWRLQTDADQTKINSPRSNLGASDTLHPGDPDALAEFIQWAKTNYPAEHYAIVLGGHGRGWKGIMLDDAGNPAEDFLTMAELSAGLSALGKNEKFDVVEFEACLMGMVEVGFQISGQAEMMVASEEIMWTAIPWRDFIDELKTNTNWTAGQYADRKAQLNARGHRNDSKAAANDFYTLASIDLENVVDLVRGPLDRFSAMLLVDMEEIDQHDVVRDNHQVLIKHGAQERAEDFADTNFKDLRHFAQLVWQLSVISSGTAADVANSLKPGGPVIRWHESGPSNDNANGLSIYFPHDLLLPDGDITGPAAKYPASPTNIMTVDSFVDPLAAPGFTDTHLYQQDAKILIPRLRNQPHPMEDDPGFEFPLWTGWDEFLHRYYKPVADACIRINTCVTEAVIEVGVTVTLSGNGSSDSDGPEDATLGSTGNDVPAHTTTPVEHYYWDFDTSKDNPAPKPNYKEHVHYAECDLEDCDRDDADEPDDDRDDVGKLVDYTCTDEGTHRIRLMVWDEHHDHGLERNEDTRHNLGRHWLHFNVDAADVVIRCVEPATPDPPVPPTPPVPPEEPRKDASRQQVAPAEEFAYEITVPANPELSEPGDAGIFDQLPNLVVFGEILGCSAGECGYDEATHAVYAEGATLNPGETLTMRFSVFVVDEPPPEAPPEIVNCATVFDGAMQHEACASTLLVVEEGPPSTGTEASNRPQ